MLDEAKELIKLGLPIIPLCPPNHAHMSQNHISRCRCPGKMPLIKDWVSRTKTTESDLISWQQQFREFNIGMPLGEASGYCGIDVDGDAGVQLLMAMSGGDLPSTWEFNTSAGSRLLYKIPAGLKTKKFKQTGTGPHEECALLCTGQQTVMPPSKHASGVQYQWVDNHSPMDMACADAPEWLVKAIRLDVPGESTTSREAVQSATLRAQSGNQSRDVSFEEEFGTWTPGGGDLELEDPVFRDLNEIDLSDLEGAPESQSFDIPVGAPTGTQKSGKNKKVVVTESMLTEPIPEGSRDNTMTAIVGHYCANRDLRRLGKDMLLSVCLDHNKKFCQPPLDDQAIIDKVNFFYDMETSKDEEYKQKKVEKPVFEASTSASNVIKHLANQGITIQYDQFMHMYYYAMADEGPWQCTRNLTMINRWIREVITSPHYGDPTFDKRSFIEETRMALEEQFTSPFKQCSDFDLGAHSEELSKYIVCKDGMVDWKNDKLLDWDPEYHTTIAFDVEYDKYADCPNFERYLSEWLPDEKVRMVIQEFLGYCLIPNTDFRKALFLYGKGRNGKSIFVEFLQEFFGEMKATLSYDALFQRFGPANLKDKIINLYDDTNVSFAKDTGIAKNLIAGGQISAEYKGKDHFTFTNVARIIYSAQETPRTADNTLAWYDRWFFVKFPNTFRTSSSKKEEMLHNMRKEKSGIFNWMIEGLRRLKTQDGFTRSTVLDEYTLEYRGLNDNVIQFLNLFCTQSTVDDPTTRITCGQLYQIYEMFTTKDNLRPVSKKVFRARLEEAGFKVRSGKVKHSSAQYYSGISVAMDKDELAEYLIEIRVILTQSA